MDVQAVMTEIGDRLDTIDGLRVFRYPPDDVTPPAAVVAFPETYTYDETFGRGMDRMTVPVTVVVSRADDRAAAENLAAYLNGSGPKSIKQVIEADDPTSFDTSRVVDAEVTAFRLGDVDYIAAIFNLDIAGTGAS